MKFFTILSVGFLLILFGGFAYFALMPTSIEQRNVTQTINLSELPQ